MNETPPQPDSAASSASSAPVSLTGQMIGSYQVGTLLGQGGMSSVYEAAHEQLGRKVAIKVLLPTLIQNAEVARRLFQEARAANQIQHPAIVSIFEHGHLPDGRAYLVMELLRGETLHARLKRLGGRMPEPVALHFARQIASGLCAAHALQIIHRDLKSENVMLVPDPEMPMGERVKILDFGIAKVVMGEGQPLSLKTATGMVMGTPHYMSPEQCKGAAQVDDRTDVYSLGVLLFEMVSGRMPFQAASVGEMIAFQIFATPPPLAEVVPGISPELAGLQGRLLAKNPAERPSMTEVVSELDRIAALVYARQSQGPGAAISSGSLLQGQPPMPTPVPGAFLQSLPSNPPSPMFPSSPSVAPLAPQGTNLVAPVSGKQRRRVMLAAGMFTAALGVLGATYFIKKKPDSEPAKEAAVSQDASGPSLASLAAEAPRTKTEEEPPPAQLAESPQQVPILRGRTESRRRVRGVEPAVAAQPALVQTERPAPSVRPAPLAPPAAPPVQRPSDVLSQRLVNLARSTLPGGHPIAPMMAGLGEDGEEKERYFDLQAGRCYTFVSVGAPPMEKLYAYLWDPHGDRVATYKESRETSFQYCAKETGKHRYLVKAAGDDGEYRAAAYTR